MHPPSAALQLTLLLTSLGVGAMASLFLGLECLAGQSARAQLVRRMLSRVLTPKILWGFVLVASVIGSRYLAAQLLGSLHRLDQPQAVDLQDMPVFDHEARTDKGRSIGLFHFHVFNSAAEVEQFMQASERDQRHVIRLADANPAANCHGWVFTGGEFGIRNSDVRSILEDNGYVAVAQPREGDLAVYIRDGQITHSGIARLPDPRAPILVQSKWGPFGLYLHPPNNQPFSGVCTFYRSPREGHAIRLSSIGSTESSE